MASIDIDNAYVSYFLRKKVGAKAGSLARGSVGANIVATRGHVEIQALRNISLHLKTGDRVGLVGVNGSGKSTLLKLCAGALSTQRGTISIQGRVSPQFALGAGIRPSLSGRRNAELKCLYMGTPQRAIGDRVERVKALSGLAGYFDLPVSSYSAGMKSRLVMGLMTLVRAEVLIMDEWIGAADPTVSRIASTLRNDLASSASILVMASHSRRVLEEWTDQIVWLEQGEIRQTGSTHEVLPAYDAWIRTQAEASARG